MLDKKRLKTELHNYKEVGIAKSVARNAHMNDLEYSFNDTNTGEFLDKFIDKLEVNEDMPIYGLAKLVIGAKDYRRCLYCRMPQDVVDAVLVDYINFVAGSYGIDYALYTKDIR